MIFLEPNMAVIGRVDLDDENVIASKDLIAVAKKAGTFVGDEAKNIIDFRASYARISETMDQRTRRSCKVIQSSIIITV